MDALLPKTYDAAALYKIEHAGRVTQDVFKTVIGFFFSIAIIGVACRLSIRLTIRRKLFFDDYLLIFGTCGLIAATATLYRFSHLVFILNALKYDHSVIPTLEDLHDIGQAQAINYSLVAMVWTATCAVKMCFLAALKPLIANVSQKITIWYWAAIALSIITWTLAWTSTFIICPYVGDELLAHCTPETPYAKTVGVMTFVTFLDCFTDGMIVAIPIYILRNVRIALKTKFAIATSLCLSLVMIIISITRMAAAYHENAWDLSWEYMMLHLESCIAITMGSLATFRSVLVANRRREGREEEQLGPPPIASSDLNLRQSDTVQRPERRYGRKRWWRAQSQREKSGSATAQNSYLPRLNLDGERMKGLLTFINGERTTTKANTENNTQISGGSNDVMIICPRPSLEESAYAKWGYSGPSGKSSSSSGAAASASTSAGNRETGNSSL